MKTVKAAAEAPRRISKPRIKKPKRPATYHHGALKAALLQAAERILERDGIEAMSIRAAAREAGVSHAAPHHHFGDLQGLLSELAAVGFERFSKMMEAAGSGTEGAEKFDAIGKAYVAFARMHPKLFLLMFRSERLDLSRPGLSAAIARSRTVLAEAVVAERGERLDATPSVPQLTGMIAAWSLVHGFSVLLLDGRLNVLLKLLPSGTTIESILDAILKGARSGSLVGPSETTKR